MNCFFSKKQFAQEHLEKLGYIKQDDNHYYKNGIYVIIFEKKIIK